MQTLPLFPLNTVLFPGMPLALHIFEERYRLMIGRCIEMSRPFGVVLIKQGSEALGPLAEPHAVGCTAHITEVERLEGGRLNITVIGRERFRIMSLDRNRPYLVGQIELFPLADQERELVAQAARQLRPWIVRYMEQFSRIEGVELDSKQLPNEPITLAYVAAALLQIPSEQKQQLLAVERTVQLLTDMRALYRREVAFLKVMFGAQVDDLDSFSLN